MIGFTENPSMLERWILTGKVSLEAVLWNRFMSYKRDCIDMGANPGGLPGL